MRRTLMSAVFVPAAVVLAASIPGSAAAGLAGPGPGVTGNDTGGIIQWTPEITPQVANEIAVAHCARWSRYAAISSYHPVYGDYVGFECVYDRRFDPRKAGLRPPL